MTQQLSDTDSGKSKGSWKTTISIRIDGIKADPYPGTSEYDAGVPTITARLSKFNRHMTEL
jgi:hypothetical protein